MPKTVNALELFAAPDELRPFVRTISTYETSLDLVVELVLHASAAVHQALAGASSFGDDDGFEVEVDKPSNYSHTMTIGKWAVSSCDFNVRLKFADERDCFKSVEKFWNYLNVILRLENAEPDIASGGGGAGASGVMSYGGIGGCGAVELLRAAYPVE